MATTTPNFGWPVPTSTDLVKDGATAIEGLGDAIDASLLDLKGGTTGQVLSKTSNTDMDFTWVAQDDSNAIQNAIVDAKGDLITATAADTPARLAVGTNGQYLQADSTTATGLKWATVSTSPTFAGCLLTNAASQSIAYNTATALTFDTERIDTDAYHSTATNTSRITIPAGKAGKYLITWRVTWAYNTSGDRGYYLYKNGSILDAGYGGASTSTVVQQQQVTIATLAEGDYLQVFALQTIAAATALNVFCDSALGLPGITQFGVEYLGA